LPLGQLAIEEGLLGVRQVLDVIRTQHLQPGRLFGEIAVDLEYLTEAEVATLLMLQQQRQRPMIDHLVELGRLTYEEAARLVKPPPRAAAAADQEDAQERTLA